MKNESEDNYTMKQYDLPPKTRTIIPPAGGWMPQTYYIVEAAFSTVNLIHDYIFFSGFLNGEDHGPGGYNHFTGTEDCRKIHHAHYLRAKEAIALNTVEGIKKL